MRRTFLRALLILVASVALGLTVNSVRPDTDKTGQPRSLPLVAPPKAPLLPGDQITLADAKDLWSSGAAFFLDARHAADYQAGHIAGAFHVPIDDFELHYPQLVTMLTPDTPLVAYCDGIECELSHRLALKLRELGQRNVRVLVNGWTIWNTAKLPTKTGDKP